MNKEKEMTAPVVSVGADTEQSSQNLTDNSLTDFDPDFKGFDEMQREILRMMDPSYLKTVSMSELLDNVYQSKPPLVDGLLYQGTYLFVGAPKLGKSFLMTQLAYHISTGTPLWNYPVRKGTVLYPRGVLPLLQGSGQLSPAEHHQRSALPRKRASNHRQ